MENQQPLTPSQALSVLDQVAAKYSGTRQEHSLLVQAVQLLNEMVSKAEAQAE